MGWFFRKSINLGGGVRLNLSKRGVGMSAGVRGFRVGVSPGGRQYIQCGAHGVYYRKSFGGESGSRTRAAASPQRIPTAPPPSTSVGPTQVMDSRDVYGMVDSSAVDLLNEIRTRHARWRLHRLVFLVALGGFVAGMAQNWNAMSVVSLLFLLIGTPAAWFADRRRKRVELFYQLEPGFAQQYQQLLTAFGGIVASQRVWTIDSKADVYDRKYHAGASGLVERSAVSPRFSLPPYFSGNVKPPMLPAGRQRLYFFPDTVLIFDGGSVGAIGYDQLAITATTTQFVESDSPPRDARQVGQTWRYVNKSGGPDRRFANNHAIPVMLYGLLRLQSGSGLHEEFQVSRVDVLGPLESALRSLALMRRTPAQKQPFRAPSSAPAPWPSI
jgi:hypothetical protein